MKGVHSNPISREKEDERGAHSQQQKQRKITLEPTCKWQPSSLRLTSLPSLSSLCFSSLQTRRRGSLMLPPLSSTRAWHGTSPAYSCQTRKQREGRRRQLRGRWGINAILPNLHRSRGRGRRKKLSVKSKYQMNILLAPYFLRLIKKYFLCLIKK